ncbi:MAG TPA: MerR family transcriptional regulator [Firmicutes bacterium]|nr:MerR family transcriptional regulator [Bacillota bacterium]
MQNESQVLRVVSDISDILGKLELTIGQVAKLGGVTSRQVAYWTEKGVIYAKREPGRAQYYDLEAVQKVRLVKRLLDSGYTLASAAEEAERIMLAGDTVGDTIKKEAVISVSGAGDRQPIVRDEGREYRASLAYQNLQERLAELEARIQYLENLFKVTSTSTEGAGHTRRRGK